MAEQTRAVRPNGAWDPARLLSRPITRIGVFIALAATLEVAAGAGLAYLAGFTAVRHALGGFTGHWVWLGALVGSLVISFAGYYLSYRGIFIADGGPGLRARYMAGVMTAGFGGFLFQGGAALDSYALRAAGADARSAAVRVTALAGMEYGVLSLGGSGAAIAVLAAGGHAPPSSFTLPWAIIPVPGFVIAFWLSGRYRQRLRPASGMAGKLGTFLDAIAMVRTFCAHPLRNSAAMPGMALFWVFDLFAAWAGLAAFGYWMSPAPFIVGAATGMVCTRRTGPLGGAGVLALVLPLCLWASGAPLPYAIVGIFAYRILALWVPLPFAIAALPNVRRMGEEADG